MRRIRGASAVRLATTLLCLNCSSSEGRDDGAASCVPGAQVECGCPGGEAGVQACRADGMSYDACVCGEGKATSSTMGSESGSDESTNSTGGANCTDAIEQPGECDPDAANHCPEDCVADSGEATTEDVCEGQPIYMGVVDGRPSLWSSDGVEGYAAGTAMCQSIGADHPCTYSELVEAEARGELAALSVGLTAWVHRIVPATIDSQDPSEPGLGGRCVDWTYDGNELADGEYLEIAAGGAVVYHLDPDTFYDGMDTTHVIVGDLDCGGVQRAILCCAPECA